MTTLNDIAKAIYPELTKHLKGYKVTPPTKDNTITITPRRNKIDTITLTLTKTNITITLNHYRTPLFTLDYNHQDLLMALTSIVTQTI